jgi:transcriptional regulator with XRE-family HTH domain
VPEKSVKAGTILIESELENIRYKGTINNTIIHECVHWSMHRKAFELERVLQKELTHLSTISSLESSKSKASATDWMEWQTESLTPKIMMPKEMFKQESQLIIKNLIEKSVSKDSLEIIESVIDELAVYFGVSRLSAKIRLVELGLDIAIGAFNYIDGKYVPTHYWSKGFLESNQTFSISLIDAGLQLLSNSELKRNVDNGALVFVEFHYCLNDSKYVSYDIFGKPFLTPYARHHMDECCIVFDISIKVHSGNQTLAHTLVLNRDKDSDIKYTIGYPKNKNISVQEKANYLMEQATDIQEGLKNITDDFGSALSYLIKWRETTNEALASDSRLSVERISRLRNNKVDKPKLKTVIALCVGLGLPPIFSFKLLETAGYTLRLVNPDERMYQMILSGCSSLTISECNELLVASGCKTLVDE